MRPSTLVAVAAVVACVLILVASSSLLTRTARRQDTDDGSPMTTIASDNVAASPMSGDSARTAATPIAMTSSANQDDDENDDARALFSIVMLTYKAPRSLTETLRSLFVSGLYRHPRLHEVIVYFQAMDRASDEKLVADVVAASLAKEQQSASSSSSPPAGRGARVPPVRAVGSAANLPVAKAMFAAVGLVSTPLVLYLECDRPALVYDDDDDKENATGSEIVPRSRFAVAVVDTALRFVTSGRADVFRLQVYANARLASARPALPRATYGDGPWAGRCAAAPQLTRQQCAEAKQRGDRVFVTAYCKHWVKLQGRHGAAAAAAATAAPQQDLCDAMCFPRWHALARSARTIAAAGMSQVAMAKFAHVNAYRTSGKQLDGARRGGDDSSDDDTEGAAPHVLCTDSEWCNWTNQPTMFRKAWLEASIKAPCLAHPRDCVGVPGRKSAVLQEVFFVKNAEAWRKRRHKICLHSEGLFFHYEVDNRE